MSNLYFKGKEVKCIMEAFCFLTKNKVYEILNYEYVAGLHMFLIKGDDGNQGWCPEIHFEI